MANNINLINTDELHQYSREFAKRLTDYFFIDHSIIEGTDVLNFCDIKQVNLLILKNLFEIWQEETSKIESPYFDYSNRDVQKALKTFMNTLSQHIHIKRDDFMHLLMLATKESIVLIVNPKQFYTDTFRKPQYEVITAEKLKNIQKYIQFNKEFLKAFIQAVEDQPSLEITVPEAEKILNKVYDDNERYIEPMDWRLKNFSDIFPIDINKILSGGSTSNFNPAEEKTQIITDETTVIFNKIDLEKKESKNPAKEAKSFQSDIPQTLNPQSSKKEEKTKFDYEDEDEKNENNSVVLNDVLKNEDKQKSLINQFQNAKVENIRSAIPLNQRFLFINKLFKGDSFAFNDAVNQIELCKSLAEAKQLIQRDYSQKYTWDFDSDEVSSFMEVLERRFA